MTRYYLNLTNGLEALTDGLLTPTIPPEELRVIRIQSTALEQSRWAFVIMELDYGFLLDLAQGAHVVVVDYSARKPVPRSLFQGVPLIKYVLTRYWLGRDEIPRVKKHNVQFLFRQIYRDLPEEVFTKLRYFRQFLCTEELHLDPLNAGKSRLEGARDLMQASRLLST